MSCDLYTYVDCVLEWLDKLKPHYTCTDINIIINDKLADEHLESLYNVKSVTKIDNIITVTVGTLLKSIETLW